MDLISYTLSKKYTDNRVAELTGLNLTSVNDTLNEHGDLLTNKTIEISLERKRQYSKIRNSYQIGTLQRYQYPISSLTGQPFSLRYDELPIIYTDGKGKFVTNWDVSNYKNKSIRTIYFSTTTGLSSNDGLTRNTPCQSLTKALTLANDTDEIRCIDPAYTVIGRSGWALNGVITKSCNITSDNPVIVFKGDIPSWVLSSGYTNVYEVVRSSVIKVVDLNNIDVPVEYEKVTSIAEVDGKVYSWFNDGTKTYVNCGSNKVPNNYILPLLNTGESVTEVLNPNQNIKLYLENFIHIGGHKNLSILGNASYNAHELYTKKCIFLFSTALDAVLTLNAKRSYHQNSKAGNSSKDGFNYSTTIGGSHIVDFIEVNTVGYGNGDNAINTPDRHNGSTAHAKSRGIRINCSYFENVGGNQIDVQGVKSVNLGITVFDSKATDANWNQGMGTQGAQDVEASELWYEGCTSFGNIADLYVPTGETVHVKLCQYDTVSGSGTRDFDERL